jgi:hypothetical protein
MSDTCENCTAIPNCTTQSCSSAVNSQCTQCAPGFHHGGAPAGSSLQCVAD